MNNNSNRIKVKITLGDLTVEVEAPVDGIEEAVKRAVLGIEQARAARVSAEPRPERRGVTCLDLVERLAAEGWFEGPRSLSEVVAELARRGYHYDPTAVAHSLLDLVRREVLGREGRPKRYLYRAKRAKEMPGEEEGRVKPLDAEP